MSAGTVAQVLYLNQWAGMELTLSSTYMHTRRVWRRHTPVTSQACCFRLSTRLFHRLPLFFIDCVFQTLPVIFSALMCTLFRFLSFFYIFFFNFFSPLSLSPYTYTRTNSGCFWFGVAATTFPSTHASSHVLQEHTHTFGTDPWVSKGAVFPPFRLLEQQQTPVQFRKF